MEAARASSVTFVFFFNAYGWSIGLWLTFVVDYSMATWQVPQCTRQSIEYNIITMDWFWDTLWLVLFLDTAN
jgi:hypothetical protein